jgi:hypothetical protein
MIGQKYGKKIYGIEKNCRRCLWKGTISYLRVYVSVRLTWVRKELFLKALYYKI